MTLKMLSGLPRLCAETGNVLLCICSWKKWPVSKQRLRMFQVQCVGLWQICWKKGNIIFTVMFSLMYNHLKESCYLRMNLLCIQSEILQQVKMDSPNSGPWLGSCVCEGRGEGVFSSLRSATKLLNPTKSYTHDLLCCVLDKSELNIWKAASGAKFLLLNSGHFHLPWLC